MAELTVETTYGEALLEAARETGTTERILEEGDTLLQILEEEPELRSFMNYPAISADEKKEVLGKIFEGRICTQLLNFLYVLVDKRRTMCIGNILKIYRTLMEKEEGYTYGTIYSVIRLSEERLAELESQTSRLLRTNVRLENEIDPALIAGVKILIDGKIIDASYKRRFDELAGRLKIS